MKTTSRLLLSSLSLISLGFAANAPANAQIRNTPTNAANVYPADSLRADVQSRQIKRQPALQQVPGSSTNMAPPNKNIRNTQLEIGSAQPNAPINQKNNNPKTMKLTEDSVKIMNKNGEPILEVSANPGDQKQMPSDASADTSTSDKNIQPDQKVKDETAPSANIPPDPNTLDPSINTPIYAPEGSLRELAIAQETRRNLTPEERKALLLVEEEQQSGQPVPVDNNDTDNVPYNTLAIMLWSCAAVILAAGGYFMYQRADAKDFG